jgi:hypothetical protein
MPIFFSETINQKNTQEKFFHIFCDDEEECGSFQQDGATAHQPVIQ